MARKGVVHEQKSSSWWHDTVTAWCGWTASKDEIEKLWFASTNCPGCLAALKKAGKKP